MRCFLVRNEVVYVGDLICNRENIRFMMVFLIDFFCVIMLLIMDLIVWKLYMDRFIKLDYDLRVDEIVLVFCLRMCLLDDSLFVNVVKRIFNLFLGWRY